MEENHVSNEELDRIYKVNKDAITTIDNIIQEYEKRYNILLTAICSGALILIFQILKEILDMDISLFLKISLFSSLGVFSIALILNLILPKIIQSEMGEIIKISKKFNEVISAMKKSRKNNVEYQAVDLNFGRKNKFLSKKIGKLILILILIGILDLGIFFFTILFYC